jgi:hypothetical protein
MTVAGTGFWAVYGIVSMRTLLWLSELVRSSLSYGRQDSPIQPLGAYFLEYIYGCLHRMTMLRCLAILAVRTAFVTWTAQVGQKKFHTSASNGG